MLPKLPWGTSKLGRFLIDACGSCLGSELLRILNVAAIWTVLLALTATCAFGDVPAADLKPLFPERLDSFRRVGSPAPQDPLKQQAIPDSSFNPVQPLAGLVEYSNGQERFLVQMGRFHQDGEAYSAVTILAMRMRARQPAVQITNEYGTAGFRAGNELVFFKGLHFVRILTDKDDSPGVQQLAYLLSETLDKGEAEIPPLVKHLPNWEETQKQAVFLNRFATLQFLLPTQSVLSVVETGGDADAALTETPSGKVLIVEYNTPQLAKDNDVRIVAKIHELWNLGQLAPIGYRRVGNYSVFVFDSPTETAAKQLIDQVKYDHVVQWLGTNQNILRQAQEQYVETTLGVFIAVVKASGFAFVGCVGLGGLIGALLFSRRRAQQRAQEAFSDAGGMLRLNLDELTPQTDPARLLGPGR